MCGEAHNREIVTVKKLVVGPNPNVAVYGKILAPVSRQHANVPVSFLISDSQCQLIILSLYNVSTDLLIEVKETVTILDPILKLIKVDSDKTGGPITVMCLHLHQPDLLLINGEPLPKSAFSQVQLRLETFS